jgi:spore maturation protein CgeB
MFKILRLNQIDTTTLRYAYLNNQNLKEKNYQEQYEYLFNNFLVWPVNYESYFNQIGYEAHHIAYNAQTLQKQWAIENQISTDDYFKILIEQIKHFKPEIVFIQSPAIFDNKIDFLKEIKQHFPYIKLTVAFRCAPLVNSLQVLKNVDLVLTCSKLCVNQYYKNYGLKSELIQHAFDQKVLEYIPKIEKKINKVAFAGNVIKRKDFHLNRDKILNELLLKNIPLDIYSDIVEGDLKKVSKSAKYGLEYFKLISQYNINLNIHIDASKNFAGNMTLFEVTGMGGLLLTDYKDDLKDFFTDEKEIITFKNINEAKEKINWFLQHPESAKEIGENAQKKVFKNYTVLQRVKQLDYIFSKYI